LDQLGDAHKALSQARNIARKGRKQVRLRRSLDALELRIDDLLDNLGAQIEYEVVFHLAKHDAA